MLTKLFFSNRYAKAKKGAWERKGILTPYGEGICRTRFDDVHLENYEVQVHEFEDVHECNVRHIVGGLPHEVIIPKNPDEYGSRFGKCSCGITKTKTIPCVHMIAATKSSQIAGLTSINVMPSWCYTAVWKEQFGEGTVIQAGVDILYMKTNYQPNPKLRYPPSIAAANKAGRKKNLKRGKSPLETKKKGKKKVKLTSMEELELGAEMQMGRDELVSEMAEEMIADMVEGKAGTNDGKEVGAV